MLGPVALVGDDGPVALTAMQRRLLAALVIADTDECTVDELVDVLWADAPPASGRKLVQVYVSQLRKALPDSIAIGTGAGAYALHLPTELLDAARFERLVRDGTAARSEGNHPLAKSLLDQALGLWRGRPYGELAYDEFARAEVERLEALRLDALDERTDAQLALGLHAEVLGDLLGLANDNPFRERTQEQAMLALYRCGRQSEALEHYAALRRRLLDELGLDPSRALRELQQRILRQDPALDAPPGGGGQGPALPEPVNRLVGREGELDELRRILLRSDVRLLVLTGAGGSGKTRLALEAARAVGASFANGTVVVELAPLDDPALVVPTITQALGIVAEPAGDALTTLADGVRARELLLVVDNAEHLQAATPVFVELLSRAPRLTMLVTSRTVLHLSGEHVFPVQPLGTDAALELFRQRATSVQPRFELTDENEDAVREICARVDGLPLAIELAAARARTLPARALAERLTERLSVLGGGAHDLPARQQTLSATLDWSYDLLSEDERRFLARFSVFPAGATLEAAASVCRAGDEDEALALVEALHDSSLLTVQELGGGVRYRLLETVRQYAADRLRELGDEDAVQRHAEWCLALAESAAPELTGDRQADWFATLEAEHDNLRAALAYLDATRQRELQLRLAVALSRFWYVRGHLVDARRRLDEALADAADQPPSLRRRALTAASATALLQGDYAAATRSAEAALVAARESGESSFVANSLSNLGAIVLAAGDTATAAVVLEEAVGLARDVGDTRIAALAINNLGDLALTTGEYERARPLFEESHALLEARGDTANLARSLFNRGAVALMLGDDRTARAHFRHGLALASETGDKEDIAWCLEGLAALAARSGDGERAATLLGAAAALLTQMGADFKPFERQLHETTERQAETLCGPIARVAAGERGAAMVLAEAIDLALDAGPLSATGR